METRYCYTLWPIVSDYTQQGASGDSILYSQSCEKISQFEAPSSTLRARCVYFIWAKMAVSLSLVWLWTSHLQEMEAQVETIPCLYSVKQPPDVQTETGTLSILARWNYSFMDVVRWNAFDFYRHASELPETDFFQGSDISEMSNWLYIVGIFTTTSSYIIFYRTQWYHNRNPSMQSFWMS